MAEIINFETRERYYTADDSALNEELEDTAFECAICMSGIEHIHSMLAFLDEREAPNVIPIDLKVRQERALVLHAELAAKLEELAWYKQHLAELRKKLPAGAPGDMSSVRPEFWQR